MRIDLSEATFIIPIRIESQDRLRNVITTTAFLLENFDTNTNVITLQSGCILENINKYLLNYNCKHKY